MSRDLDLLDPSFRLKVDELLSECEQSGYIMRPFFTLRTPFEQARLWRQSRSSSEIREKINELTIKKAVFLAHCLESVGPQNGNPVTNAIPGLSWHQWGEAVDCFWLLDNKASWSTKKKVENVNGYVNYGNIASSLNLTSGGFWSSFKDWPHVQLKKESSPSRIFSLIEINDMMEEKFSTP